MILIKLDSLHNPVFTLIEVPQTDEALKIFDRLNNEALQFDCT